MLILLFFFIYGLLHPLLIATSTKESLILFGMYVLPSLFFYIFILDVLLRQKSLNKAINTFYPVLKYTKIRSKKSSVIIITSLLVGNPANAKSIIELYDNKEIDYHEANYLLSVTHYTSIGFIITFIGRILNDFKLSINILISNILANIILMLFTKNKGPYIESNNDKRPFTIRDISTSITNTINTILVICAITILFGIIIDIFLAFNYPTNYLGFIEITRGIKELNFLDKRLLVSIIGMFTSFGGLSVHMQIYAIIGGKLNYPRFFINRLIASILSFLILYLCW